MGSTEPKERWEGRLALAIFCGLLGFHFWGATVGWRSLNLPGCEFRQTQTGLSAFFIQHEQNFSLAYPTPVLGKPWAIPLEFPLYQWTVVWVSDFFHQPLTQAARAVSLACFYLSLPAMFLLLVRTGLARARCWLVLGLVVTCPLYIYYSRAFLIETMALMFGAWFLAGYVRAVEQRSFPWLGIATAAGIGCGLVKVTTFLFFLLPAFLETIRWFWGEWKTGPTERGRRLGLKIAWAAAAVVGPFAASIWWVRYSDQIKAASIAGKFLVSAGVAPYNFGTGVRFSPALWAQHWHVITHDLATIPVLVAGTVLAVFCGRRWWALIGALVGMFFLVQLVFPILYAWHEYYYVANAFMLMFALGFAACSLFEARWPRWAGWVALLGLCGLQMGSYLNYYYPGQRQISNGGSNLTLALKSVMAPDEVMVVAGDDWSSMTPYYAQRRAYMIRRSLETTWEEIERALAALKDDDVTALVLHGEQARNQNLIGMVAERCHLDPRPAFKWRDVTVYVHEQLRPRVAESLRNVPEIELLEPLAAEKDPLLKHELGMTQVLRRYQADFAAIKPTPFKFYTTYGTTRFDYDGHQVYNAHSDTRFWFNVPAGKRTLVATIGIVDGAYDAKLAVWDQSDGVELRLEEESSTGARQVLFSRLINPRDVIADRGLQRIEHTFEIAADSVVVMSIGPGPAGNYARDWAMLGPVEIK